MKYLLIIFSAIICLSCEKKVDESNVLILDETNYTEILEATGCKVTNYESIDMLFCDTINVFRYIYGARLSDKNQRDFWFSKYDENGDVIWEINIAASTLSLDNVYSTHSYLCIPLSNGNIISYIVGMESKDDIYSIEQQCVLINSELGEYKIIQLTPGFKGSEILSFGNCIWLYSTQSELDIDPSSNNWLGTFKLNLEGDIIKKYDDVNPYPFSESVLFLTDTTAVEIEDSYINKRYIFGDLLWGFYTYNPNYEFIPNNDSDLIYAVFNNDTIIIDNANNKLIKHTVIDNLEYCNLNQDYITKDSLKLCVNSIIQDETSTIQINYILTNISKSQNITEGTFKLFELYGKGINQYGVFSELLPNASITRSYSWSINDFEQPILEYSNNSKTNFLNDYISLESLKWKN